MLCEADRTIVNLVQSHLVFQYNLIHKNFLDCNT